MSMPLFQPFRALGYITDSVPFSVQRLGRETFVTVSVGKSWQVHSASVSTHVKDPAHESPMPAAVALLHCESLIYACVHVYNCSQLRLVLVGPQVRAVRLQHTSTNCSEISSSLHYAHGEQLVPAVQH